MDGDDSVPESRNEVGSGIRYWLLTEGGDDGYTPFQGFGLDIVNKRFADLIELLAVLPASSTEIFVDPERLSALRGPLQRKQASIVGLPTFLSLYRRGTDTRELTVIIGLPSEIRRARDIAKGDNFIFVTTEAVEGAVNISEFEGHPAQILDKKIHEALVSALPPDKSDAVKRAALRAPFLKGEEPSRIAGVTAANEVLAMSLGFSYDGANAINPGEPDAYVDAILVSASQARRVIGTDSTDIILYAPAIVRHLYAFGSAFWNKILRKIDSKALREIVKNGVFRNPGYSGFTWEQKEKISNPYDDPVAGSLLAVRQSELRLTAAGIGALASSGSQVALRFPNSVNFCGPVLREIESYSGRDDDRGQKLLRQSYTKLVKTLSDGINPRLLDEVRDHGEAITIVSDAPIEWLRLDGLPLMFRHELSRIGMTPGNLMLQQCLHAGMHILPARALNDVLVVRSFSEGDPIRLVLETAIQGFPIDGMKIKFVDVSTRAELVAALNAHGGPMVVFDCHGGHGGDDKNGWLNIGREKVDPWSLAHEARVPPIVILSACSTFALAGSHASVANGFIRSGALTVIGTFLPVDAFKSATFVARLLYRIDGFLPALKAIDRNFLTWRTLISTFLRMSFSTDLLRFFIEDKQWLQPDMFTRIGSKANFDINRLRNDWYGRLLRRIAAASGHSIAEVQAVIDAETPLVETMYYCQIGRPELLGIFLGDKDEWDQLCNQL